MKKRGLFSSSKRSQITAFMMIGIVILIIFAFMLSISSAAKKSGITTSADSIIDEIKNVDMLKNYVSLCLKGSLEDGLVMIGMQGGNIWVSQGGIIDDSLTPPFPYQEYKVTYGIKNNDQIGTSDMPDVPKYPCISSALSSSSYACSPTPYHDLLSPRKPYYFGIENLPPLCDLNGPNVVNSNVFPFPCPAGSYGPSLETIQVQLNRFIESRIAECVDLGKIMEISGFDITANPPNISVIFGENDVIARATYPINITAGSSASTRFLDFEAVLPVRMKAVYGLADYLVKNDARYINFNVTESFNNYRHFGKELMPRMAVSRYCPKCDQGDYTTIINITDSFSLIRGNSYVFRFAVVNRIPALDKLDDVTVNVGDSFTIAAKGYDPDDESVTYSYDGWAALPYDSITGIASYTPSITDVGSHTVKVSVYDASGLSDYQEITIHVTNTAP